MFRSPAELYRRWDEVPTAWGGRTVDPHFVHLPCAAEDADRPVGRGRCRRHRAHTIRATASSLVWRRCAARSRKAACAGRRFTERDTGRSTRDDAQPWTGSRLRSTRNGTPPGDRGPARGRELARRRSRVAGGGRARAQGVAAQLRHRPAAAARRLRGVARRTRTPAGFRAPPRRPHGRDLAGPCAGIGSLRSTARRTSFPPSSTAKRTRVEPSEDARFVIGTVASAVSDSGNGD